MTDSMVLVSVLFGGVCLLFAGGLALERMLRQLRAAFLLRTPAPAAEVYARGLAARGLDWTTDAQALVAHLEHEADTVAPCGLRAQRLMAYVHVLAANPPEGLSRAGARDLMRRIHQRLDERHHRLALARSA